MIEVGNWSVITAQKKRNPMQGVWALAPTFEHMREDGKLTTGPHYPATNFLSEKHPLCLLLKCMYVRIQSWME